VPEGSRCIGTFLGSLVTRLAVRQITQYFTSCDFTKALLNCRDVPYRFDV
jgi:hypothetical protein